MSMEVWDTRNRTIVHQIAKGAAAISGTLDNLAMSDQGSGTARIPMTGHGFVAGSQVLIHGSTNYDGLHIITNVNDVDTFDISVPQLMDSDRALPAEVFGGGEFCGVAIYGAAVNRSFRFIEARLHLSNTAADETITMTIDSGYGAVFDCVPKSENINGKTSWDWLPDVDLFYTKDDILKWTWANGNTREWGFELIYEVM